MHKPPAPSLHASLSKLATTIPKEKIFYLQISDGSDVPVATLLKEAKSLSIHPLYAMSNSYRPLPPTVQPDFHGRMPVRDVVEAVLKTGWRGPVSYEVCLRPLPFRNWSGFDVYVMLQVFYKEDMQQADGKVPDRWTRAAMEYHVSLLRDVTLAKGSGQ